MSNTKGKVITKNGKAYWVASSSSEPTNITQEPTQNKMIPMARLTKEEKDILRNAHSYIHIDEYYKHKEFLKYYREFHQSTGSKYIDGGFDKFKVACVQARRT